MNLGIIERKEPIIDGNRRKAHYVIKDQFFRFWYRFVPGNLSSILSGTFPRSYDPIVGSYLNQYMGLTFEEMCRQYLTYYDTELPFPISDIGSWWGAHPIKQEEVELDIVAIAAKADNTKAGRELIIGSCKYTSQPVDTDELALIQDYASIFTNANDTCYYYIFSKSGFTSSLTKLQKNNRLKLIALEDMYTIQK